MSIWDLAGEEQKAPEKEVKKEVKKVRVPKNTDPSKVAVEDFSYDMLDRFSKNDLSEHEYIAKDLGFGYIKIKDKQTKEITAKYVDKYNFNGETIRICPEPITFLHDYDSVSNSKKAANDKFREDLKSFKTIDLNYTPTYEEKPMWLNKTLNGINLRPGRFVGNEETFKPISMNDDGVHGLIVGRTGSGKSVFINQLILSLITEYSPWELDLYLADFKKVELSRYMNDSDEHNEYIMYTPHVKACAATSEIRYVISLMKNLVDRMNARNEFFTRLGITKIKDFRTTYNLVLPRVLLIVDEFQQLFTEASTREAEEIQFLLNSITKLGRATGFHLIFASQEMSGTLNSNTLSNFKIRMALPCEDNISRDILGNSAASRLERNFILINTDSGDEIQNKKYHVPFIETEEKESDSEKPKKTDFFTYLDNIKLCSKKYDISYKTDTQKFYREELQEKENEYIKDLDRVKDAKNTKVKELSNELFDAVVLGKTVLYTEKKNDKVTMYLEKGRNKGILITSPDTSDIANIRKLLVENLTRSEDHINHVELNLNKIVNAKYVLSNHLNNLQNLETVDFVNYARWLKFSRAKLESVLKDDKFVNELRDFVNNNTTNNNSDTIEEKESKLTEINEEIKQLEVDDNYENNLLIKLIEEAYTDIRINDTICDIKDTDIYKKFKKFNIGNTQSIIDTVLESLNTSIEDWNVELESADNEDIINEKTFCIFNANIIKELIIYFINRYNNMPYEAENNFSFLNLDFNEVYNRLIDDINSIKQIEENLNELDELNNVKNHLEKEIEDIRNNSANNDIVRKIINMLTIDLFNTLEINHNISDIKYEIAYNSITLINNFVGFNKMVIDECQIMIDVLLGKIEKYDKYILWINGLDEIQEFGDDLIPVIIDSINYDILVIANASTLLDDILLRRTFDYVFVTGRVEKLYDSYDIGYTKPTLNSIVINSAVRSKALEIPFKIYKSENDKVKTHHFLDDLL